MVNNLQTEMQAYSGCYQQGWPLQVDLQITLLVPILAIIYWKVPIIGFLMCIGLIVANGIINFHYADKYQLKIGILTHFNWYLLQTIICKPWTKLAPLGAGIILSHVYVKLVHMRSLEYNLTRKQEHPVLYFFNQNSKCLGITLFSGFSLFLVLDLVAVQPWFLDPHRSSQIVDNLYFAIFRPLWSISTAIVLFSLFIGRFGCIKEFFSNRIMRAVGRMLIITCVVQILIIDLIFYSNFAPDGIYLTPSTCLIYGIGFIFISLAFGMFIYLFIEFPIQRLIRLTLYPYITHDYFLAACHELKLKNKLIARESGETRGTSTFK